jgi:hypothetical protein
MACAMIALPQTTSRQQRRIPARRVTARPQPTPETPSEGSPDIVSPEVVQQKPDGQEVETLKIDTNLVTVPIIATNIEGAYIPDLRQNEFSIQEDGSKQEVAFFATVSAPFHVVLLLDTSGSTQQKLGVIQQAAVAFVEQLQSRDRVKVISFDDKVRELNEFTNDRAALKQAIYKTTSGEGTKLYDAFELALSSIRTIAGRRAIVLFSDGVDWHSDAATLESTLHFLDEEGVIVYPIRYETRQETERIAREQSEQITPQLPTLGNIRTPAPPGTTAPTFPSDEPDTVPTSGRASRTGPLGLPSASEILRRRREQERREQERNRDPNGWPAPTEMPPRTIPGQTRPDDPRDTGGFPDTSGRRSRTRDDSISMMLDHLYSTADNYLNELAKKSGGRVVRADTLNSLPDAFANIAAELRTQYLVGYYPTNKAHDGQYRKIKVSTTRQNVIIRARPGYHPPAAN